jgi:hypothetical protein
VRALPTGSDVAWRSGGKLNLAQTMLDMSFKWRRTTYWFASSSSGLRLCLCGIVIVSLEVYETGASRASPLEVAKMLQGLLRMWGQSFR